MTLEEIEIGQEVICTSLRLDAKPFGQTAFRGVGHIGKVVSVFPLEEVAFIGHTEMRDDGYVEFLTSYFLDELEIYEPEERPLQKAIANNLVQITRD